MCGIYFQATQTPQKIPEWILELGEISSGSIGAYDCKSIELSRAVLSGIISQDLARDAKLSEMDQRKLDNVEKLRSLQEELNKYKNVKHKEKENEKLEQIKHQISALVGERPGGIHAEESQNHYFMEDPTSPFKSVLARGPDYAQLMSFNLDGNDLQLLSSVLLLRQPFTKQPLVDGEWILQFNGELYNNACRKSNDTCFIMEKFVLHVKKSGNHLQSLMSVVKEIEGEFAYVLLNVVEKKVYFGKDAVGKRSLLFRKTENSVVVASVLPSYTEAAVECKGNVTYLVDLSTYKLTEYPLDHEVYRVVPAGNSSLDDTNLHSSVLEVHKYLGEACAERQSTIHPIHSSLEEARVGILFSGGLDCTVLAALIGDNFIESNEPRLIDLLTVGFDNPRTGLSAAQSPDRVLSEQSWYELAKRFYGTCVQFRLVQINVTYAEWLAHRQRVRKLIYPCATEMDLSIAIAFYFAARATNCELLEMQKDPRKFSWHEFNDRKADLVSHRESYTSKAKVLFSGLGADELFGGYSRHENIFHGLMEDDHESVVRRKYEELSESLIHDINVIYERNLGRDDRAMSSWGKELRYPYLDETFIRHVIENIPPEMKVHFEWSLQKTKKGEKRVMLIDRKHALRRLAKNLGLEMAAKEVKRAIQFGAKSAKMEVGQQKTRGTDSL